MVLSPTLRGLLEQWIDFSTSEETLNLYYIRAKDVHKLGLIDSIPSFIFGLVFESTQSIFFSWLQRVNKEPSINEAAEFLRVFNSRGYMIKTRISQVCNR